MVIGRGKHWTDERAGGRSAQRTIRNHANYETAGGLLVPTSQGVGAQSGPPAHWSGQWDFSHAQIDAPLQVYTRDSTDTGNRALMGINPSNRPDVWATWKAVNANACEPVIDGGSIFYPGLWDGASWRLVVSAHKVKDYIELESNAAPSSYRWTLKLAPGCTLDPRADGIHLLDGDGASHGKITYPIAWDENGSEEAPNLGVSMGFGDPVGPYATIEIALDPAGFAAAVGRIVIDPQVVISGAADLDDNWIWASGADKNFGGSATVITDTGREGLLRVATASLPAGTVTAASWSVWPIFGGNDATPFRILAGNQWGEGTGINAIQAGASCANWAQYNTAAWVGGGPMLTAGVDYDNTDPGQALTGIPVGSQSTKTLPAGWFNDWIGGTQNNGWALVQTVAASLQLSSQEQAVVAQRWIVTLEYTAGAAGYPAQLFQRRR